MPEALIRFRFNGSSLDVPLHVQPRSRKTEIAGLHGGALKLKVTAPPVDDAANTAVIQFFASRLNIARSRIRILSGNKSRDKTVRIDGLSQSEFLAHLPEIASL